MSGRSPPNRHNRYEDVEAYRHQSRQNDRRYREHEKSQGATGRQRERQSNDGDAEARDREKKLSRERERELRMARLREEHKKQDEEFAALERQQRLQAQAKDVEDRQPELKPQETIIEVNQEELEGLDEEEQMRKLLGFDGFGSTKGEAVEDNQSTAARGGAAKNKARKYRQYMNRKNGFNRPLEKMS